MITKPAIGVLRTVNGAPAPDGWRLERFATYPARSERGLTLRALAIYNGLTRCEVLQVADAIHEAHIALDTAPADFPVTAPVVRLEIEIGDRRAALDMVLIGYQRDRQHVPHLQYAGLPAEDRP